MPRQKKLPPEVYENAKGAIRIRPHKRRYKYEVTATPGEKMRMRSRGKSTKYLKEVVFPYYVKALKSAKAEIINVRKKLSSLEIRANHAVKNQVKIRTATFHKKMVEAKKEIRSDFNARVSAKVNEHIKTNQHNAVKYIDSLYMFSIIPSFAKYNKLTDYQFSVLMMIYVCKTFRVSESDKYTYMSKRNIHVSLESLLKKGHIECGEGMNPLYYLTVSGKSLIRSFQKYYSNFLKENLKDEYSVKGRYKWS